METPIYPEDPRLKPINSLDNIQVGSLVKSILGYELPVTAISGNLITLTLKKDFESLDFEGNKVISDMYFRAHYTTFKLIKR